MVWNPSLTCKKSQSRSRKRFANGMITGHFKRNLSVAKSLGFSGVFSTWILVIAVLAGGSASSFRQPRAQGPTLPTAGGKSPSGSIVAQGRLQPTQGILKLSAIPGDRIERVLVQPGADVAQGEVLVELESAKVKKLELELAELKLSQAVLLYEASLREGQLAVDTAEMKLRSAEQMQSQAKANLELVGKQSQILRSLDEQLQSLEAIRNNPRLRGAVGSLEIEAKRNQKINAQSEYERSLLGASQATESTQDLVAQAQSAVRAAKEAFEDMIANPSYRPLEKQIELLRIQLDQATLLAPGPGSVLQVAVIAGERTATVPLIEMADLSQMSCVAEVHESDVGLVRIGQVADMKSASLSRSIRGKVSRIDRLVGIPQIRSPNPLARSDFRSVAVWIQIDADDVPIASQRVQLQVEVAITP